MRAQQVIVDSNFIAKGLNVTGAPAITDAERNVFVSEVSLTAGMVGTHKAADLPHLTMNDKVFAARHNLASLTPVSAEASSTVVVPPIPDTTWTTDNIRIWLAENGITYSDAAFGKMSKEELLDAVSDVNSTP